MGYVSKYGQDRFYTTQEYVEMGVAERNAELAQEAAQARSRAIRLALIAVVVIVAIVVIIVAL